MYTHRIISWPNSKNSQNAKQDVNQNTSKYDNCIATKNLVRLSFLFTLIEELDTSLFHLFVTSKMNTPKKPINNEVKNVVSPPRSDTKETVGWIYVYRVPFTITSDLKEELAVLKVGMVKSDERLLKRLYEERNDFKKILSTAPDIPYATAKQPIDLKEILELIFQEVYDDLGCLIRRTGNDVSVEDTEIFGTKHK